MALNLRLPEELNRQLDELAVQEHTSKHALILKGAEMLVQSTARRKDVDRGIDFVLSHDAELLSRLKDA